MKKHAKTVSLLIVLLLLLAAFGTAVAEDELVGDPYHPETLTGRITSQGFNQGHFDGDGLLAFMELYPNLTLENDPIHSYEKNLATIAAGEPLPSFIMCDISQLPLLTSYDIWEDVSQPPYNEDINGLLDYIQPNMLDTEGRLVGFISGNCVCGIMYNRELAKEYFGTDDPDELADMFPSLEVMLQAGEDLYERSEGKVYMFAADYDFYGAIGDSLIKEPYVVDGELNFTNAILPRIEILAYAKEYNMFNLGDEWSPTWNMSFYENQHIFKVAPTYFIGVITKEVEPDGAGKYGIMPWPKESGFVISGGTAYLIPRDNPPQDKLNAFAFLNWLCYTAEGGKAWVDINGQVTCAKALYDEEEPFEYEHPFFCGQKVQAVYRTIVENLPPDARRRPATPFDAGVGNAVRQAAMEVKQGNLDVQGASDMIIQTLMAQYPDLTGWK